MLTRRIKQLLVLGAVVSISGCGVLFGDDGVFRDSSEDYLNAESIAEINVPKGFDKGRLHELYAIPPVDEDNLELLDSSDTPRPLPLSALQQESTVKIQKLYGKRWILVNTPPSEVWPRVRNFLNVTGLPVAQSDAHQGVLETTWLEFKNDPEHRDKYRIRLEQGVQIDSTEIHIRHVSVTAEEAQANEAVQWPDVSSNSEREGWLVDELASAIAANMKEAGASSLLAQTIAGGDKVLVRSTGVDEPVLILQLGFNRAWATVRHSISQEGFTLWGEDAERQVFYVQYQQPKPEDDEEPGFFSRLFSSDKPELPTSPVSLATILSKLPNDLSQASSGAPSKDVPGYLIVVTNQDGQVDVRIRNSANGKLRKKDAKRLLTIIRRNLI